MEPAQFLYVLQFLLLLKALIRSFLLPQLQFFTAAKEHLAGWLFSVKLVEGVPLGRRVCLG